MRRYRLQIGSQAINLSTPDLQGLTKGRFGFIRDLVSKLGSLLISLFLVSVALLAIFHINYESVLLYYGLYAVILLLAGWAIVSVLTGSKFTIDPPLFVPVLLFALLTTTAYLLSPNNPLSPTDPRNTFGVDGARFIAAIGVITFIFLFYFMVTYLRSARRITWASRAVLLGAALVPVIYLLVTRLKLFVMFSAQVDAVSLLLAVWIPVNLLLVLFRPMRKVAQLGLILSLVLSVVVSFQDFTFVNSFATSVVLLIILVMYLWHRSDEFDGLGKYLKENLSVTFTGEKDWQVFISESRALWMAGFVIVWILLSVVATIVNKHNLASVVNGVVADYRTAFQSLIDIRTLVVGNGAAAKLTGTTVTDIISFQGLLGVIAYITITVAVIRVWAQKVKQYLSGAKGLTSFSWVWFPLIITLPLLALVTKLNMVVALLWWVMVAMMSAILMLQYREKEVALWETWKVKSANLARVLPFAQIVVIVVIVGVGITLINMLTQLFVQGVI